MLWPNVLPISLVPMVSPRRAPQSALPGGAVAAGGAVADPAWGLAWAACDCRGSHAATRTACSAAARGRTGSSSRGAACLDRGRARRRRCGTSLQRRRSCCAGSPPRPNSSSPKAPCKRRTRQSRGRGCSRTARRPAANNEGVAWRETSCRGVCVSDAPQGAISNTETEPQSSPGWPRTRAISWSAELFCSGHQSCAYWSRKKPSP
jgi:hypothetical protein